MLNLRGSIARTQDLILSAQREMHTIAPSGGATTY